MPLGKASTTSPSISSFSSFVAMESPPSADKRIQPVRPMNAPLRRLFLRAIVASLSATAALAIGTLLFADFDDTAGKILATTALISAASLLSLPGGILLDQSRATTLAWAVIGLSAGAFFLSLVLLWGEVEDVWKAVVILAVFAGASSQTAASTARRRPEDPPGVGQLYLASIVLSFGLATLLTV